MWKTLTSIVPKLIDFELISTQISSSISKKQAIIHSQINKLQWPNE
jgi:hypothetical protein